MVKNYIKRNKTVKLLMIGAILPFMAKKTLITIPCTPAETGDILLRVAEKSLFLADIQGPPGMIESVFYVITSSTEAFVAVTTRDRGQTPLNEVVELLNGLKISGAKNKRWVLDLDMVYGITPYGEVTIGSVKEHINAKKQQQQLQAKATVEIVIKPVASGQRASAWNNQETSTKKKQSSTAFQVKEVCEAAPFQLAAVPKVSKPAASAIKDPRVTVTSTTMVKTLETRLAGKKEAEQRLPSVSLYVQASTEMPHCFITNDLQKALFEKMGTISFPQQLVKGTSEEGHIFTLFETPDCSATCMDLYDIAKMKYVVEKEEEFIPEVMISYLMNRLESIRDDMVVRFVLGPKGFRIETCRLVLGGLVLSQKPEGYLVSISAEYPYNHLRLPRISTPEEYYTVAPWVRTDVIWYNMELADKPFSEGSRLLLRFFQQYSTFYADTIMATLMDVNDCALRSGIKSVRMFPSSRILGSFCLELTLDVESEVLDPTSLHRLFPRNNGHQEFMLTLLPGKTKQPVKKPSRKQQKKKQKESSDDDQDETNPLFTVMCDDFPKFVLTSLASPDGPSKPLEAFADVSRALTTAPLGILISRQGLPPSAALHPSKGFRVTYEFPNLLRRLVPLITTLLNQGNEIDTVEPWFFCLHSIKIEPLPVEVKKSGKRSRTTQNPKWVMAFNFIMNRVDQFAIEIVRPVIEKLVDVPTAKISLVRQAKAEPEVFAIPVATEKDNFSVRKREPAAVNLVPESECTIVPEDLPNFNAELIIISEPVEPEFVIVPEVKVELLPEATLDMIPEPVNVLIEPIVALAEDPIISHADRNSPELCLLEAIGQTDHQSNAIKHIEKKVLTLGHCSNNELLAAKEELDSLRRNVGDLGEMAREILRSLDVSLVRPGLFRVDGKEAIECSYVSPIAKVLYQMFAEEPEFDFGWTFYTDAARDTHLKLIPGQVAQTLQKTISIDVAVEPHDQFLTLLTEWLKNPDLYLFLVTLSCKVDRKQGTVTFTALTDFSTSDQDFMAIMYLIQTLVDIFTNRFGRRWRSR